MSPPAPVSSRAPRITLNPSMLAIGPACGCSPKRSVMFVEIFDLAVEVEQLAGAD